MPAQTPEEICSLFKNHMANGDLDSLLTVYDPEAVILDQSGEVKEREIGLREQLGPFAAARAIFDYNIKQVVRAGDIALMHTQWNVSWPQRLSVYAIEVARRQSDGTWRWLIGDPFTVSRETTSAATAG
jgi:ketosteroid isomerase-like protein